MNKSTLIHVLVADDHRVVRQGLVAMINRRREMQVVAEAEDGKEAVRKFNHYHPDICLIDLRMPRMDGVEAIYAIRELDPEAKIIVLTTYDDDEDIYRALQYGAKAYLLKDISVEELIENIKAVHQGSTCIPPQVAVKLAARLSNSNLTAREMEILHLLAAGKTNKQIASTVHVTDGTVKVHVNHILQKLGATGRTDAVSKALKRGLIRFN